MRRLSNLILVVLVLAAGCLSAEGPSQDEDRSSVVANWTQDPDRGPQGTTGTGDASQVPDGASPANETTVPDNGWPAQAEAVWRGDLQRTGYLGNVTVPEDPRRVWQVDGMNKGDHTAAKGSAVIVDGSLLVGTDGGTLYRLSLDGGVQWAAATWPSGYGIHGTPTVANGTVFIGAYDGALYAFDLATGEQRWRTVLGGSIGSSPAYHDGRVYVSVETAQPSGIMSVVDAATGELIWEDTRLTNHPHSSVALSPEDDRMVVGANDGLLYAWELSTYEPAWVFETDGAIKGPIAIWEGAAFFGSWDHNVYRVDLTDGTETWAFEADADVMSGAAIDPTTGTVYIGSHDEHVYALDAETGEERWSTDLKGWVVSSPVVAGDTVLVGSYDEQLYALDKATGQIRWTVEAGGRVTSTATVHDGQVFYLDRAAETTGGLYAVADR